MANRTKAPEKQTWERKFQEWFVRHLENAQASVDKCDQEIDRRCAELERDVDESFLANHDIGYAPHMVKMETLQLGAIVIVRHQRNAYLSKIKRAQEGNAEALMALYDVFRRFNKTYDSEILCRMCNAIGASHHDHSCPVPPIQSDSATT